MTTLSQLAAGYNAIAASIGQSPVRRFSNRNAAERRLAQLKILVPPVAAEPEPYQAEAQKRGASGIDDRMHAIFLI